MRKYILACIMIFSLLSLSGCTPESGENLGSFNLPSGTVGSPPGSTNTTDRNECYKVEEEVSFDFSNVHYIRVFNNGQIMARDFWVKTRTGGSSTIIEPKMMLVKAVGVALEANPNSLTENEIYRYAGGQYVYHIPEEHKTILTMEPFLVVRLDSGPLPTQSPNEMLKVDIYMNAQKTNLLTDKDEYHKFIWNCNQKNGTSLSSSKAPESFFKKEEIVLIPNSPISQDELSDFYTKIREVPALPANALKIGQISFNGSQNKDTYEVFASLPELLYLKLEERIWEYEGTDTIQEAGVKTLKLGTFQFTTGTTGSRGDWYKPICPVMYLYPQKETSLSLWLYPKGFLTKTEPEYKNGWKNLWLNPSGKIFYQGKFYSYLHYEAMVGDFKPPKTGFVVKKEDLSSLFDEILPKLGLNEKEAKDFKDYWLLRLKDYPYFQVSLLTSQEIEEIEPIKFSQKPETFIRVRFYFKGLKSPIDIKPPEIKTPLERLGFTAVEWGGLYDE